MNEAMGLAGFNPMVGSANGKNMIVNSLSNDKDISGGWGNYSITDNLTKNSNSLIIDKNGKLNIANNGDHYKNSKISVYVITDEECNDRINEVLKELEMDYDQRPVHDQRFLYEAITNHKLITKDQFDYDPSLEKIDLNKASKIINNGSNDISFENFDIKDGVIEPDKIMMEAMNTLDSLLYEMEGVNNL